MEQNKSSQPSTARAIDRERQREHARERSAGRTRYAGLIEVLTDAKLEPPTAAKPVKQAH